MNIHQQTFNVMFGFNGTHMISSFGTGPNRMPTRWHCTIAGMANFLTKRTHDYYTCDYKLREVNVNKTVTNVCFHIKF